MKCAIKEENQKDKCNELRNTLRKSVFIKQEMDHVEFRNPHPDVQTIHTDQGHNSGIQLCIMASLPEIKKKRHLR